jgi:hypothetical protein
MADQIVLPPSVTALGKRKASSEVALKDSQ